MKYEEEDMRLQYCAKVQIFVWWGHTKICTDPQLPSLAPLKFGAKFGARTHSRRDDCPPKHKILVLS